MEDPVFITAGSRCKMEELEAVTVDWRCKVQELEPVTVGSRCKVEELEPISVGWRIGCTVGERIPRVTRIPLTRFRGTEVRDHVPFAAHRV